MDTSPRFALPMIMANQAQKHLTHNEALVQLEPLVQAVVQDVAALTPPTEPVEMECVIVGAAAADGFAGKDHTLAAWIADTWHHYTPEAGWIVCEASTQRLFVFDGTQWVALVDHALASNVGKVGINASASTSNRLTVASDATLLTAESQDHRLTINKAGVSDTASMVFQSGWSGRAEMGLAGHDGFAIKVSTDGSAWHEALAMDPASGIVSLPLRPVAKAALTGGSTSFPAGREIGFDSLVSTQGGFALGTALASPSTGASLTVPADGTYVFTVTLLATALGQVSVKANGSTTILTFDADLSSATVRTFQITATADLTQGDDLTLVFDDAATCLLAADDCWFTIHRL